MGFIPARYGCRYLAFFLRPGVKRRSCFPAVRENGTGKASCLDYNEIGVMLIYVAGKKECLEKEMRNVFKSRALQ
jgi:hypothetical protein